MGRLVSLRPAKWLLVFLLAAGLAYAGLVLLEDRFIYFPASAITATPADVGLSFEDVEFRADDGVRLHGWWVAGPRDGALLWFHGNGGNLSHRVEHLRLLHDELGVGILALDYRGYGKSEGKPSEQGLYADARAALEFVTTHTDTESHDVVLFGQSLGSAVAVELATAHGVRGVVLEAPFTSIPDMARHHYRWLPVAGLLRTEFDTEARVGDIDAPLLILHGESDGIVPPAMAESVLAAADEPKRLEVIEGAGHNDIFLADDYAATLGSFLEDLEAPD